MGQKEKKTQQLGMNPATASNRLVKDLLFTMLRDLGLDRCYHCSAQLDRDTFSIEHKIPWLDSEDPLTLFFDLHNIAFSHKSCNYGAARRADASSR